ncbi:hypothetical protein B9Z65_7824 [Elsinoe australis]|uniref:Anaphase-promoting complex subunit 1 N-terminal domain-containing protein n=1 Tax=Elsinoe australis TaxID=40998 RepID=A0A2P8A0L7_9PEZI|nr:hypothetical protein B9Z65_7824 [Elsinoe australis]
MAEITSLGIHAPSALHYLVAEGALPHDPPQDSYNWRSYLSPDDQTEEEILWTKDHVVYSRDGYIQRVFTYRAKDETVHFAVVTNFSACGDGSNQGVASGRTPDHALDASKHDIRSFGGIRRKSRRSSTGTADLENTTASTTDESRKDGVARALVILVGKQCHVHYLAGTTHIISVPFDVANIFPTAEGIVVQRATTMRPKSSGGAPGVPPNSFYSSQFQASPYPKSPLGPGRGMLNFSLLDSPSSKRFSVSSVLTGAGMDGDEDDLPNLWSLTDPLSDLSACASATVAPFPRHLRTEDAGLLVEYDDIDASESLLYVSPNNELPPGPSAGNVGLMLLVTMNEDLDQITIWQGWYLRPKSLSALTAVRKAVKESRARRRSSLNNAASNAGPTPTVRIHDKGRESFAATARLPTKKPTTTRRKKAQLEVKLAVDEEEAMASRMDPDFRRSQQTHTGTRRAGSLLSRGDLATSDPNRGHAGGSASHAATARRGPSMRMSQDRRSFGTSIYRKSRGSVPGSTFSRSIGADEDDSMDLGDDSFLNTELDTEISRVTELFLATYDFASVDSTFSFGSKGIKPELILRKIHVLPLSSQRYPPSKVASDQRFKVRTLHQPTDELDSHAILSLWVHDKLAEHTVKVHFETALASISTDVPGSGNRPTLTIAAPVFRNQETQTSIHDIAKVQDDSMEALVSSSPTLELTIAPNNGLPWSISFPRKMKFFDSVDVRNHLNHLAREVGMKRTIELADSYIKLSESAKPGRIFAIDSNKQKFDLQLRLHPRDPLIRRALRIAQAVLSRTAKQSVTQIWALAYIHLKSQKLSANDAKALELEALIMMLFSFAVGSLGRASGVKSRKSQAHNSNAPAHLVSRKEMAPGNAAETLSLPWKRLSISTISANGKGRSPKQTRQDRNTSTEDLTPKFSMTDMEAKTRSLLHHLKSGGISWLMEPSEARSRANISIQLLLAIQLFREELKLTSCVDPHTAQTSQVLAVSLAQLAHYLHQELWDWKQGMQLHADFDFADYGFSESEISDIKGLARSQVAGPFSVNQWLEDALVNGTADKPLDLQTIAGLGSSDKSPQILHTEQSMLLPRLSTLYRFLARVATTQNNSAKAVQAMQSSGMSEGFITTLPDSTAGYLKEFIARCQSSPPSIWPPSLLRFVDREDLIPAVESDPGLARPPSQQRHMQNSNADLQSILNATERMVPTTRSHEADRHAVIAQIFSEDRRFVDAARLTNSAILQVAECPPQPGMSDEEHLEQQKKVMQWVMNRTISLPAGSALVHFESQKPLISEKFQVAGFSTLCQMKPMDNTVSADKTGFTEEKLSWSFFHAGASAGLHISKKAAGIDTSWIVFNKPDDLTNRHAGFLLALGLNGHLRSMAKWLAFKYLTPKHTMTSIGLLLGLSASYMGTMDSLITRMLSVHITRMLPAGAAELNVSPLTQTVGLLGIGLLYYNTQHRRMSEIMISELEHREIEEPGSAADNLRDESYRLAAGFSLGLMNLGKGNNLQGLQRMGLLERLLSIAIGPRPVELVHVVDKATAGATIALTFIYMKTNDVIIARKIDVPDTPSQHDHIRPDILLLRALAKNLIMWDSIIATPHWIRAQLHSYASHYFSPKTGDLIPILPLRSSEIPLYNIITGHAWSLALKYAGTASLAARDEILAYLDVFWSTSLQPATYYDAQLARTTIRRCIDMLALSAATVMAGTGDVTVFRYLRRLHGRTDAETTYGSHMAAHLAVGSLFLGGGTYTFSTGDLAVAGLVMAFYPLWPSEVLDNAVHLQALRHLWVLAAEARCVVCQDVDSGRPVQMDVRIQLKSGEEVVKKAPCLLPELATVASVETVDEEWWRAKLDFERNEGHLKGFKESQVMWVRRAPASEENPGLFGRALKGLNERQNMPNWWRMWAELLELPALECLDESELGLAIPSNAMSGVHEDEKGTVLDDRLALLSDAMSWDPQRLWNVRLLLSWAEKKKLEEDGQLKWLGDEFVQRLGAIIRRRMAEVHGVCETS